MLCQRCKELDFSDQHRCPPEWAVWADGHHGPDEEGDRVFAHDAVAAAEKWAEEYDYGSGHHPLCNGRELEVLVSPVAFADKAKRFRVRGEMVPSYGAYAVKEKASA